MDHHSSPPGHWASAHEISSHCFRESSPDERFRVAATIYHGKRSASFQERFNAGLPDEVRARFTPGPSTHFSRILLDNSTIREAFHFCHAEEDGFDRWMLSLNRQTVADALSATIEALVLYEEIHVSEGKRLLAAASQGAAARLTESVVPDGETLFWLLSAAKHQALLEVQTKGTTALLKRLTGGNFSKSELSSAIERVTVQGAGNSIHKIVRYLEDDGFYFDGMAWRFISRLAHGTYGRSALDVREEYLDALNIEAADWREATGPSEFFAALLLIRTIFYLCWADMHGLIYIGDSYRSPLVRHLLKGSSVRQSFARNVVAALEQRDDELDRQINTALQVEAFQVTMPMVANAVMARAKNRRECLDIAADMRDSANARRFRKFAASVDEASVSGDRVRVEKALAELSRYGLRMMEDASPKANSTSLMAVKNLVGHFSPIAATIIPLIDQPLQWLSKWSRFRKFALLDELSSVPRTDVARQKVEEWWPSIPNCQVTRVRDFGLR